MSIHATNITKTFGDYLALDDVSLSVGSGKLVALLGPSGSGKTTLLRILSGLEEPDPNSGGRVQFHGHDVTRTPPGKRRVGFVFQNYALFRHMTVSENVAFGLKVRRRAERPEKPEIAGRVQKLLDLVQLGHLGGRYPNQLSGGQRQRIALARALAVEPEVLLLDEPFGALDAQVRKELRRWLRKFHEQIHLTTVFVTHDQEEALELADEVVVMNQARVEQVGTPSEVYNEPATPFVVEFLGDVNRLSGKFAPSRNGHLYVRPHDIWIHREEPPEGGLRVRVEGVSTAGPVARLDLLLEEGAGRIEARIPRSAQDALVLTPGDIAYVRFLKPRAFSVAAVPKALDSPGARGKIRVSPGGKPCSDIG